MPKGIDQDTALEVVRQHIVKKGDWDIDANQPQEFNLTLTSFSRTSEGWAAEMYTDLYPLLFFCVIYSASKNEMYLAEYRIIFETTISVEETDAKPSDNS